MFQWPRSRHTLFIRISHQQAYKRGALAPQSGPLTLRQAIDERGLTEQIVKSKQWRSPGTGAQRPPEVLLVETASCLSTASRPLSLPTARRAMSQASAVAWVLMLQS